MQDFSTEFFILWEVLTGSYLVSKSLTSHLYYHICITSLCAICIHVDITLYIIYDIDLVSNLERRGHCDIVRTIDIHC